MAQVSAAERPLEGDTLEQQQQLYGAPPAAMAGFLEYLLSEFGSAGGYLESVGLSSGELNAIREHMLE